MDVTGISIIACTVIALGTMCIGFVLAAMSLRANDDAEPHPHDENTP